IAQKISMEQPFSLSKILDDDSMVAAFPDTKYRQKKTTHGHRVKQKYGVNGAYEEAILGNPHIRLAIQAAKELDNDSY
ncbi:triphosphoribosyl-dephospho-CoA synthase MdcB, partial [Enterococcus faecium]